MVRKLAYSVSEREHWISGVGGLLGILLVWLVSFQVLDGHAAALVATSMGSTAVLLFAAPHGAMSQPWAVFGGHLVSALIGVACVHWLGHDLMLAASVAVGLSITAMYSLRCLHAPGGATALGAVLGGDAVHAMGYAFVWSPIMLNALIMLAVAIAFNYPFAWRRYPQAWARRDTPKTEKAMIPHSRLVYALSQIDTFVDISEEDLQRIYELAMHDEARAAETAGSLAAQSTRA
jgi:CBS-domain-containing membrane protein